MLCSPNKALAVSHQAPAQSIMRWTSLRKLEVLTAIDSGSLALEDALRRHNLSIRELEEWRIAARFGGPAFLRVSSLHRARKRKRQTLCQVASSTIIKGGQSRW